MVSDTFEIGYLRLSAVIDAWRSNDTTDPVRKMARTEMHSGFTVVYGDSENVCADEGAIVPPYLGQLRDALIAAMSSTLLSAPLFVKSEPLTDTIACAFTNWQLPVSERTVLIEEGRALPKKIDFFGHALSVWIRSCPASTVVGPSCGIGQNHHHRVLVVGAGGIGCEVMKCLVMVASRANISHITVIDLDTIDATNLNRQFLFSSEHVGESKSVTAAKVLLERLGPNSSLCIEALHDNVKSPELDTAFFRSFQVVLNGLDNLSARKHVNRMCMAAGVPLVESGTMGFNGQVHPIMRGVTECYDCHPKTTEQKSFAVCTIHARPTSMVHCVHYAKELLERVLERASATSSLDQSEEEVRANAAGSSAPSGASSDFTKAADTLATALADPSPSWHTIAATAQGVLWTLFVSEIETLLRLKDESTWKGNKPQPVADVALVVDEASAAAVWRQRLRPDGGILSLVELQHMFQLTLWRLVQARSCGAGCLAAGFRKEDDNSVAFVATIANLRAHCFNIPQQPLEALRSIAGNIIPAIATSNAIIAACVVNQGLALLRHRDDNATAAAAMRLVYLRRAPLLRHPRMTRGVPRPPPQHLLLHSISTSKPVDTCGVCGSTTPTFAIAADFDNHTIGSFVDRVLRKHFALSAPFLSVEHDGRVLFEDGEFETLRDRTLAMVLGEATSRVTLVASDFQQNLEDWRLEVSRLDLGSISTSSEADGEDALSEGGEGDERALQLRQAIAERTAILVDGQLIGA